MTSLSATAFMFDGQMIDTVMMAYESRKCGGAKIHAKGNAITFLAAVADELHLGLPVDKSEVERVIRRYTDGN